MAEVDYGVSGLIIAIESYPDMKSTLSGTNDAAISFTRWLLDYKGVPQQQIYVCAAEDAAFPENVQRFSTTKKGIKRAIRELAKASADKIRELYVYYSGHGAQLQASADSSVTEVIVPSDFESWDFSNDLSIELPNLQERMKVWLGGEQHVYFVDACRIVQTADKPVLGLRIPPTQKGKRRLYTFLSVRPNEAARVDSGWSSDLIKGLQGAAPDLLDGTRCVSVRSLSEYAKQNGHSEAFGDYDPCVLLKLEGVAKELRIVADSAQDTDHFRVVVTDDAGKKHSQEFAGKETLFRPETDGVKSVRLYQLPSQEEWIPKGAALLDRFHFERRQRDALVSGDARRRGWKYIRTPEELMPRIPRGVTPWERLVDTASAPVAVAAGKITILTADSLPHEEMYALVESDSVAGKAQGEGELFVLSPRGAFPTVSLVFEKGASISFLAPCHPEFATLVVVHRDENQKLAMGQVMFRPQENWPSGLIRESLQAQWDAAHGKTVRVSQGTYEPFLNLFLYRDRLRGGEPAPSFPAGMPELPDLTFLKTGKTEVHSRLLLLETWLAAGKEHNGPLPAEMLDYSEFWACWRGFQDLRGVRLSIQLSQELPPGV